MIELPDWRIKTPEEFLDLQGQDVWVVTQIDGSSLSRKVPWSVGPVIGVNNLDDGPELLSEITGPGGDWHHCFLTHGADMKTKALRLQFMLKLELFSIPGPSDLLHAVFKTSGDAERWQAMIALAFDEPAQQPSRENWVPYSRICRVMTRVEILDVLKNKLTYE